jgi:taurine dioxygenase
MLYEQIARPAYTARFRWYPGSLAFWDNRASAHVGPMDLSHIDVPRILYRITIAGEVPVSVAGTPSYPFEQTS